MFMYCANKKIEFEFEILNLKPWWNGRHYAYDISKLISVNENYCTLILIKNNVTKYN